MGEGYDRENSGYQAIMADNAKNYRVSGLRIAAICAVTILFMIVANLVFIFFATSTGQMTKEFADYAGGRTWSTGFGLIIGVGTVWVSSLIRFAAIPYIYSFIYLACALGTIQSVVGIDAKGMTGIGSIVLSIGMAGLGFILAVKWIPVMQRRKTDVASPLAGEGAVRPQA